MSSGPAVQSRRHARKIARLARTGGDKSDLPPASPGTRGGWCPSVVRRTRPGVLRTVRPVAATVRSTPSEWIRSRSWITHRCDSSADTIIQASGHGYPVLAGAVEWCRARPARQRLCSYGSKCADHRLSSLGRRDCGDGRAFGLFEVWHGAGRGPGKRCGAGAGPRRRAETSAGRTGPAGPRPSCGRGCRHARRAGRSDNLLTDRRRGEPDSGRPRRPRPHGRGAH
jgi:hypothetical protein